MKYLIILGWSALLQLLLYHFLPVVVSFHTTLILRKPLFLASSLSTDFVPELKLSSPCKINLFLRVLRRRSDGYHDLASLFQAVSLSDHLSFSRIDSNIDIFTCSDPSLPQTHDNLVIRALTLMRKRTKVSQFFRVHLEKRIPAQAGLGGGSGNAATAMFAFQALTNHPEVLEEDLMEWSGELGADVPFFFTSGTAYCTDSGVKARQLPPLSDASNIVVHLFKPQEGLATAAVFRNLQLSQCSETPPEDILSEFQREGLRKAAEKGMLINDLERPAIQLLPKIQQIKETIRAAHRSHGSGSEHLLLGEMMSGSGSTVFALTTEEGGSENDSRWIREIVREVPGLSHYLCRFTRRDSSRLWYY